MQLQVPSAAKPQPMVRPCSSAHTSAASATFSARTDFVSAAQSAGATKWHRCGNALHASLSSECWLAAQYVAGSACGRLDEPAQLRRRRDWRGHCWLPYLPGQAFATLQPQHGPPA